MCYVAVKVTGLWMESPGVTVTLIKSYRAGVFDCSTG